MPSETQTIQWYPGHMVRAMRRLADDLRLIDVVIEVVDARVPAAGRNPHLARIVGKRSRLLVLSRADLASPNMTTQWLEHFQKTEKAVALDATSRASFTRLQKAVAELTGENRSARAIVLGIPNAGKSTVINGLVGRSVARTENRAGVTRAAQWFRMHAERESTRVEIMDTAGILVPKIDTGEAQWKLAIVGAVPRARFDPEDVVTRFAAWAAENGIKKVPDLETFAQSRGFMQRGTLPSLHNAAWSYLKDINEGRFGRITFEIPR